ncbi:hypothetical protein L1D31_03220 [Vibrio sp. Isolate23]|uniref:hypothetical protein n=1 Tax=Vibrio sp. Isolate23 TaxID=2908533 RepID=UPI001EFCFB2A|nr:hypothetical protein [Vibrio sp. Isolate23]MCG9681569.1 hypothetical protein [Vibrio sp. Isolate23]
MTIRNRACKHLASILKSRGDWENGMRNIGVGTIPEKVDYRDWTHLLLNSGDFVYFLYQDFPTVLAHMQTVLSDLLADKNVSTHSSFLDSLINSSSKESVKSLSGAQVHLAKTSKLCPSLVSPLVLEKSNAASMARALYADLKASFNGIKAEISEYPKRLPRDILDTNPASTNYADWLMQLISSDSFNLFCNEYSPQTITAMNFLWQKIKYDTHDVTSTAEAPYVVCSGLFGSDTPADKDDFVQFFDKQLDIMIKKLDFPTPEIEKPESIHFVSIPFEKMPLAGFHSIDTLITQVNPMLDLIKATQRQTSEEPWLQWFKKQIIGIPTTLRENARSILWFTLGQIASRGGTALGLHFGGNLLTPLTATVDFNTYMAKQLLLYDLKQHGKETLKLKNDDPVMASIILAIDNIDWAAVRYSFKVTPFGLLISAYSGFKWVARKTGVSDGDKSQAQKLLEVADLIHNKDHHNDAQVRLALITIFHLVEQKPHKFVEIMTCRTDAAISTIADKLRA